MKSGTTTLHEHLGTHPEIYMCPKKEPAYFVEEYGWSNGAEWYSSLFAGAQDEKYLGESTTDYTKMPRFGGVPERIRQHDPSARFIYVLRDPVERTFSHYWWRVRFHGETRQLLNAIQEDAYYRTVSNYAFQLKPYFDLFDRAQFNILTFEQLVSDPQATCREIFQWLGVDDRFQLPSKDARRRSMPEVLEQVRGRGVAHRLRYSKLWGLLGPRMPKPIRSLGKRIAVKEVVPSNISRDKAADWLRSIQIEEVEELSNMVGMAFPEWRTLYANA